MAGFFGFFDYTKPGKGVDKNAPEKRPFPLFFELVWQKLGRLVLLNLLYFVILLPILTAAYILVYSYLFSLLSQARGSLSDMTLPMLPSILLQITRFLPVSMSIPLLIASIVLYGPATCGLTYMLRNFALRQHTWNSDFFVQLKQNFKQGLALGLMDILLLCLFAYNLAYTSGGSAFSVLIIVRFVSVALLIVYLFMRNYLFVMTVTCRLTVPQILKNSFFLAVLGWKRNFLVLLINGALFALALFISPILELLLLPFFLFSFTGFVSVFTCYPVVKKYVLNSQAATEGEKPV